MLESTSPQIPADEVARRLDRLRKEAAREVRRATAAAAKDLARAPARRRLTWRRIAWYAVWVAMVMVMPLVTLVGGAAWLYRTGTPTVPAVLAAALATVGILTGYGAAVSRTFTGKLRLRFVGIWVAAPVVTAYAGFSLLYLSAANAKSDDVRSTYRTVHPVLRLAVATATLADDRLVVTDAFRVPEDYDAMGLPRYENSLHFRQADGYVHAMDLRTLGRSGFRNAVMIAYFRVLGFRTLRHVGTADHLHVSLPPPT